jgi:hypothetical protein
VGLAACAIALACAEGVAPDDDSLTALVVYPTQVTLGPGSSQQFSAYGRVASGDSTAVTASWEATGGSVDASGRFMASSTPGTYVVTATHPGQTSLTASASVFIVPLGAEVVNLRIWPRNATVVLGDSAQFTTYGILSTGDSLPANASWSAVGGSVSVRGNGVVDFKPNQVGAARVRATLDSLADSVSVTVAAASAVDTLFVEGFESGTLAVWNDNFLPANKAVVTDAAGARSGSRFLRITYPLGSYGGSLSHFLQPGYEKMYARYYVRLPANWQGGTKLMLLRGSRVDDIYSSFGVAGQCPNGTNFFLANAVTRTSATLPVRFYTYYVGMAREGDGVTCYGRYGDAADPGGTPNPAATYFPPLDFSRGVWHEVELEVTLNTPGSTNAMQRLWIDGVLRGEWSGFAFRTTGDLMLNAFTIESSTSETPSSPQNQALDVDDILVTTGRPGGI